jgi:hypothetical protein
MASTIVIKKPILHNTLEKLINESICRSPEEMIVHSDETHGKNNETKQIITPNNPIFPQKDICELLNATSFFISYICFLI